MVVPLVPPTGNSYVRHTRDGRHYVTKEAKAFQDAVAILSGGAERFTGRDDLEVWVKVFRGKGDRGDADNYLKVTLDSVVKAGLIVSDDDIVDVHVSKRRDRDNPRTEIRIGLSGKD